MQHPICNVPMYRAFGCCIDSCDSNETVTQLRPMEGGCYDGERLRRKCTAPSRPPWADESRSHNQGGCSMTRTPARRPAFGWHVRIPSRLTKLARVGAALSLVAISVATVAA